MALPTRKTPTAKPDKRKLRLCRGYLNALGKWLFAA